MRLFHWGRFIALAVTLGLAGCEGNPTVTVVGQVTYKGVILKGGNVTFVSTEGKASRSTQIGEDGRYTLEKVPVGKVAICVDTAFLDPSKRPKITYKQPPGAKPPGGYMPPDPAKLAERYTKIPAKYAKPETSGLTYTVENSKQDKNINLGE